MKRRAALLSLLAAGFGIGSSLPTNAQTAGIANIETVVVIYAENRGFDNLYGSFPGANGLQNVKSEDAAQRDRDGSVLKLWLASQRGRVLDAPYVWSSGGAEFPDATFAASARTQTVGPVPQSIRIPGATPNALASPLVT